MAGTVRRLLATADLHFHLHPEGDDCTLALAAAVCESDCDAFVIAGDVGGARPEDFEACLRLFEKFRGLKLLVPGNHDLWCATGSSMEKYRRVLPAISRRCGFHYLDRSPVTAGDVAFIGSIGWYDYSFRNPAIGLDADDYRRKAIPGVCKWNDKDFIRWEVEDAAFLQMCVRKLRRHYRAVEPAVARVVCVLHHVPFAELLYGPSGVALEFCRAYLGSERLGGLLRECEKVRHVLCGHRHGPASYREDHLEAFVIGSEYARKRLLELGLEDGTHQTREFAPA